MALMKPTTASLFGAAFLLSPLVVNAADDALIAAGEQQAAVCKACHQVDPNGITVVGPPLYGLADREIAAFSGFNYSDGLSANRVEGKTWDAESLDAFLTSPADFAPGTNMAYPGVKDPGARAAIIAWLATKNPTPPNWQSSDETMPVKALGEGILTPDDNMALVASTCSVCHSLHLVVQQGLSRDSWDETLEWMVDEQGMDGLDDGDHERVLDYLATYYGE
ncbi:cytochrome C [Enterovibrio norvegicus]|uniref:Cytochrome c n=2 Tax=Enterovibrio norvegicus TaxID=188144 RepID=A0A1I5X1C2_9GAMM|nr:c-type cytochrome [Enterovibrio norvegicus]OEF56160.1 cytochrome C [Enterovibrio norvegicus]SFQ25805.1 cytochrome c [Enterovibrio norvegicus DSM 15893]